MKPINEIINQNFLNGMSKTDIVEYQSNGETGLLPITNGQKTELQALLRNFGSTGQQTTALTQLNQTGIKLGRSGQPLKTIEDIIQQKRAILQGLPTKLASTLQRCLDNFDNKKVPIFKEHIPVYEAYKNYLEQILEPANEKDVSVLVVGLSVFFPYVFGKDDLRTIAISEWTMLLKKYPLWVIRYALNHIKENYSNKDGALVPSYVINKIKDKLKPIWAEKNSLDNTEFLFFETEEDYNNFKKIKEEQEKIDRENIEKTLNDFLSKQQDIDC